MEVIFFGFYPKNTLLSNLANLCLKVPYLAQKNRHLCQFLADESNMIFLIYATFLVDLIKVPEKSGSPHLGTSLVQVPHFQPQISISAYIFEMV